MKSVLCLCLLLLPVLAGAQALISVKKRSAYFLERFEVKADDKKVRQGLHQKWATDRD